MVPSKQDGVGLVCKSFREDINADSNPGGVDSPSESLSEIAQEAAAKVQTNVATSKNEGLKALPYVSSMVEGVGSLPTTLSKDNKDDVNAEGGGSPSIFLSRDKQVNMCENL